MILKLLAQLQKNLKKTFLGFKKNPQPTISKTVAKTVKTVAKTVIAKAKSLSQLKVFARIFTRTPPILKIKHPNPVNHVKPILLTGNDYALGSSTSTCINSVTYPQDAIVLKNRDSNQEVVSRLHLTMRKEPKTGNYILKDERSQNGTYKLKFWRGLLTRLLQRPNERLNHQITLHDGDVISLSDPDFQDAVIIKYIYPPVWYIRGLWYGLWGLVWALILTFLLGCLAVWSVSDVIVNPIPSIPAPLAIYANDGKTLVSAGISTKHQPAERLLDFPPLLIKTLFASEDQNYYWHPGINPIRIVKSSFENLLKRDIISGASTITQQLARTLFSYEVNGKDIWGRKIKNYKAGETTDTLERKFREAGVALKLSLAYPKDALLLAYLNNIDLGYSNLGQGIRGFGDASDFYFAKSIRTMSPNNYEDVARVATVVALVRNPAYAYAVCDKEGKAAQVRLEVLKNVRNALINKLVAEKLIQPNLGERAKNTVLSNLFANGKGFCQSPDYGVSGYYDRSPIFLTERIRAEVRNAIQDDNFDNLIVVTSLDIDKQDMAREMLHDTVENLKSRGVPHGALITIDSDTGEILALVGETKSSSDNIYDYAATEELPPGSTFKMFAYVDALKNGMPLRKTFACSDLNFGGEYFSVSSYSSYCGRSSRKIDLRTAVAISDNLVPLKVVEQYSSLNKLIETAEDMGITSKLDPVPRIVFGQSRVILREMVGAYAVLANGGKFNRTHSVKEIYRNTHEKGCDSTSASYKKCDRIYSYKRDVSANTTVLKKKVADDMTYLLQAVVKEGTGRDAYLGLGEAGKTGTSDKSQDGWFIGYIPKGLATGVWLGNLLEKRSLSAPSPEFNSNEAAVLWGNYMYRCHGAKGCSK